MCKSYWYNNGILHFDYSQGASLRRSKIPVSPTTEQPKHTCIIADPIGFPATDVVIKLYHTDVAIGNFDADNGISGKQ